MPANLLLKYEDKQTILQENSIPSRLKAADPDEAGM